MLELLCFTLTDSPSSSLLLEFDLVDFVDLVDSVGLNKFLFIF